MKLEDWYALIIPNGHIEFWKFPDEEFHKDVSWEENQIREFKATLNDSKKYAKKYNLKFLYPSKEFEKQFKIIK